MKLYIDMDLKDKEEILFQLNKIISEENKPETEKYDQKEAHGVI